MGFLDQTNRNNALFSPLHKMQRLPEDEDPLLSRLCTGVTGESLTASFDLYDDHDDVTSAIMDDRFVLLCMPEIKGSPHFAVNVGQVDEADTNRIYFEGATAVNGFELKVYCQIIPNHC